jgi:hypothetical protein
MPAVSSLQQGQYLHNALDSHIRSAYPSLSSVSPEMLKGMDIPKQLLGPQQKSRLEEEKAKGQHPRGVKGVREKREDLKPFKRQSYHVAIAYHIHIKRIKTANPSATEIDPTYPARKLRESQSQPEHK